MSKRPFGGCLCSANHSCSPCLLLLMGPILCLRTPRVLLEVREGKGRDPWQSAPTRAAVLSAAACSCTCSQAGAPAQQVAFFPINLCQTLVPIFRFAVLCSGHWGGKAVQALTHSKNPRGNGRYTRWISWAEVKGTQWDLTGFLLFREIKGVIRKIQTEQKSPQNLK